MSMTAEKIAPGNTGAKVTSFNENAARAFVKKVMDEHPHAGRDEIVRKVRAMVTGRYDRYLPSFVDYATINAWRVIRDGEKAAAAGDRGTTAEPAATTARISSGKSAAEIEAERHDLEMGRIRQHEQTKSAVKTVLLDLLAPNGKLWRELSIAEYMTFGKKQLTHGKKLLASGHKRTELLGAATTEAELLKVYK